MTSTYTFNSEERYFGKILVALKRAVLVCSFKVKLNLLGGFLGLLGQKNSLDVGKDTTLGNGDS